MGNREVGSRTGMSERPAMQKVLADEKGSRLARPGWLVEIEAVAALDD